MNQKEKTPDLTRGEQVAQLRAAIARSGLSNRRYAEHVLMRDERTIRRWLSGTQGIPKVVLRRLTRLGNRRHLFAGIFAVPAQRTVPD